jgi:polyisoprenoid-binding protein YceI
MNNNIKNFVSKIAKPVVMGACLLAATATQAGMSLVGDESTFSFITSKNATVTEIHSFKTITGDISDAGVATVNIDLASVDTAIAIRDERMQKLLFETTEFTKATFTADVVGVLKDLKKSGSVKTVVTGELSLHGQSVPVSFDVLAVQSGDSVFVSTLKPTLIQAGDFDLTAGVEKLREIAGLQSINPVVPASFVLMFN